MASSWQNVPKFLVIVSVNIGPDGSRNVRGRIGEAEDVRHLDRDIEMNCSLSIAKARSAAISTS